MDRTIIVKVSAALWTTNKYFTWWQSILIGTALLVIGVVLSAVVWYILQESIIEYGYPKVRNRTIKKRFKFFRPYERLFLHRLCREAHRKGFMLWLCWSFNLLNCISVIALHLGYVGVILTQGAGWALCLLLFPPYTVLCLYVLLFFIPGLVFLPSERSRYKRKRK